MRAECTAMGVISFSNWTWPSCRRIKKEISRNKRPRGLSTGGRYGAIALASYRSWSAPGVSRAYFIDTCEHEDVTEDRARRQPAIPLRRPVGASVCWLATAPGNTHGAARHSRG